MYVCNSLSFNLLTETSLLAFFHLAGAKGEPGLTVAEKGFPGPKGLDGQPGLPGAPGTQLSF